MPLLNCDQRSPEWFTARLGKVTASLAAACLGLDSHTGPITAWKEIKGLLARSDKHLAWGREHEASARLDYEVNTGNLVEETGLWIHDDIPWLAASPDGLIGEDGLVEIKCPARMYDDVPIKHLVQMQVQLACTGREWCDYYVWQPHEFRVSRILRTPEAESALIAQLTDWYNTYVKTDTPPPRRKRRSKSNECSS